MGMSASQARFLSLTARKNNVEFEGQQINQQRTTLSNESASYYSELCNMKVPTPPSIDDYTKISYTFNDGAMTNTLTSLLPDTTPEGRANNRYVVNYVEEWQDDYAIVPASSSLVEKKGDVYSIGNCELRKAGVEPTNVFKDEYYQSLSPEQRTALLQNEEYLLKMVQDKTGDDGDFYIRYIKNTTTGNYEPYLYAYSELSQESKYNNKNLGSIPCYTLGSTTQTREVLHQYATVEKDASGRYVALTIDFGSTSETKSVTKVIEPTEDEIEEYNLNKPKPEDFMTTNTDSTLYQQFKAASASCYITATSGPAGFECYEHVLAHMLDLTLNSEGDAYDPSAYPKYFPSSASSNGENDTELKERFISDSAIKINGKTPNMLPVSDALREGWEINGVVYPVITTTPDKYISGMTSEALKYLGTDYITQENPTDAEKLLSNYTIDPTTGEPKNKSLRQKCIDILKILTTTGYYGINYNSVLVPLLKSMQQDMEFFTLYDESAYQTKLKEWEENPPKSKTTTVEETVISEKKRTYPLTTITTTDEEAYNDAMNQYNYAQHEYDHKIQEINSKLKIVQMQDKQLELKLKQLDTEENAISTEMDAVKKVISKNVESSFKTFNA